MDASVSAVTVDGKLYVVSPYSRDFVDMAHQLGGKWDKERRAWAFDPALEAKVLDVLRDVYGWEPEPVDQPTETVAITINLDKVPSRLEEGRAYMFFGQKLLWRPGRDLPVRLADGVAVIDGKFTASGGSRANPCVDWMPGTRIRIPGMTPAKLAWLDENGVPYEIEGSRERALTDLKRQRAELMERLAKLDGKIAELENETVESQGSDGE